jgi:toxin ParE1/3/4
MVKVRWTLKAISQIEQIFNYIAHDSVSYASRFVSSLVKTGDSLSEMPLRGRIVPEFQDNIIR